MVKLDRVEMMKELKKILNISLKIKLHVLTFRLIWPVLLVGLTWPLVGCGQSKQEGKVRGLSGLVFNYSDEAIASVWVDGEGVGGHAEAVRPGDVTGGGQTCCFSMDPSRHTVPVRVQLGGGEKYTVQAEVEQPWPKDASTVIVHVLPKHKIIIEATLGVGTAPRSDLINARLSELGITKEVNSDKYMLPGRSEYSDYMEVKKDE